MWEVSCDLRYSFLLCSVINSRERTFVHAKHLMARSKTPWDTLKTDSGEHRARKLPIVVSISMGRHPIFEHWQLVMHSSYVWESWTMKKH